MTLYSLFRFFERSLPAFVRRLQAGMLLYTRQEKHYCSQEGTKPVAHCTSVGRPVAGRRTAWANPKLEQTVQFNLISDLQCIYGSLMLTASNTTTEMSQRPDKILSASCSRR